MAEIPKRGTIRYRILEAIQDEALSKHDIVEKLGSVKLSSVSTMLSQLRGNGQARIQGNVPGVRGMVPTYKCVVNLKEAPPAPTPRSGSKPSNEADRKPKGPRLPLQGTRPYLVLQALQSGELTTAQIARATGIPPKRVANSACKLIDQGLIEVSNSVKENGSTKHTYKALVTVPRLDPDAGIPTLPPKNLTAAQAIAFLEERGYRVVADPLPPKGKGRAYL